MQFLSWLFLIYHLLYIQFQLDITTDRHYKNPVCDKIENNIESDINNKKLW